MLDFDIIIRKYKTTDILSIMELCDETEHYAQIVKDIPSTMARYKVYRENCFVALLNNSIIGVIYGGTLCDTLYPQFLFVSSDYRKRGIGRMLMEKLEQESKCKVSMIFYSKELNDYYSRQNYNISDTLAVGMKTIGEQQ